MPIGDDVTEHDDGLMNRSNTENNNKSKQHNVRLFFWAIYGLLLLFSSIVVRKIKVLLIFLALLLFVYFSCVILFNQILFFQVHQEVEILFFSIID
jgi:succinate-acetate transporter protein